ncbi:MAG: tail fiber domain-containing protein, partial [Elusimicrobiota bacterium]
AGGSTLADAWTPRSSIRWKQNIRPIDNALDKLMRLNGVYFDWKVNGKHDLGMIAEETGKVIPEVVDWDPENPKYASGLNYDHLVGLLVEAVKEQQKRMENQQKEIETLKEKIMKLEKKD